MRRDWDQRARKDAQHYIACGHAETDHSFWESGRRDLEQLILHDVELSPESHALEVGCGLGRILRPLSERIARVYGVDISVEMVEQARRALTDRPNIQVALTRGRLDQIPDASLDFVYSFIVFQHIPSKKAVEVYVREADRVLKGDGVFRFQVDGRPRHARRGTDTWLGVWYELEELAAVLSKTELQLLSHWGEHTHYLWVTARRRAEPGRPTSNAIRVVPRSWSRQTVEALVGRLGGDPSSDATAVVAGRLSLRQLAEPFLRRQEGSPPEEFVRCAYEVILGREADADGLAFYSKEISRGIPPSNTVDCLLSSAELENRLRPRT
jgi:SAM-dependent methyltransferase